MDCTSLRAFLKSELPENYTNETLVNTIMAYYSHKGMEWTRDDEVVISEYGEDPALYLTFDENQLMQLDAVESAAQALIDALCEVPEYLEGIFVQDGIKPLPSLIAEAVANMLKQDMAYVFFPSHVEAPNGVNYITDIYED